MSGLRSYLSNVASGSVPEVKSSKIGGENSLVDELRKELQNLMWDYVGIVRRAEGLSYAVSRLQKMESEVEAMGRDGVWSGLFELRDMVTVAELIAGAASIRRESRGTHYLVDCPETDDVNWQRHIVFECGRTEFVDVSPSKSTL